MSGISSATLGDLCPVVYSVVPEARLEVDGIDGLRTLPVVLRASGAKG